MSLIVQQLRRFSGLVVMISVSHLRYVTEGPRFEHGLNQLFQSVFKSSVTLLSFYARDTYYVDEILFLFPGPREAMMICSFIKINPHLSGPSPGKPGHLHWDVTQPPSSAQFIGENETLSFDQFCDESVTAPTLIPWEWFICRTVGVALKALFSNLADPIDERYVKKQSEEWQTNL